MRYKNLLLSMSIVSILLMYGCGKQGSEQNVSKESTVPQSEVANQSDINVKTVDNMQLTSSNTESEKLNYTIEIEKYVNGKINIEYPQIRGLNTEVERKINKFLEDEVYKRESYQDFNPENTQEEKFEVKTQNENFVSILVKGYSYGVGAAHGYSYVRTYNIDLSTGKFERLVDTGKTEEFAAKIFNGEYKIKGEEALKAEMDSQAEAFYGAGDDLLYHKGYDGKTIEEIKQELDTFDIDTKGSDFVLGYSYYEDDKIVLCIEVNHALGDYLELVFD